MAGDASGMRRIAPMLALLLSCTPTGATRRPSLGEVLGRVDVPRLLKCAAKSGSDRARCLGAAAATTALDRAVDRAAELAERAREIGNQQAGASDSTDGEREAIAADLDDALEAVAREVAAAQ